MRERAYQSEMVEAVLSAYNEGIHQQLIVAATGTGKTVVMAQLIPKLMPLLPPGKVLVFAHREELVDQAIETIRKWNPGLIVGKEMAEYYADEHSDIIVSCVASIGRTGSSRLSRLGSFSLVLCDEAHHSIAQTYLNVFEMTGVLSPDTNKLLIGFTATPKRKNRINEKTKRLLDDDDLISLKSVYKKIVKSYPIRKAVREGWLVPIRGYRMATKTDISEVKTVAGDFQQDQLSRTVNTEQRNQEILEFWKLYGENRQTVGYAVDIAHALALAKVFRDAGYEAEAVWGDDPFRAYKLAQHKAGKLKLLFNAQVLTEGYDDWKVSCIIEAAPTRSATKYTQCVGRATRLQAGTGNLLDALQANVVLEKMDCIILDVVDNSKRCTLVTLPTLCGLSPDFDLEGQSVVDVAEKVEEAQEKYPHISFANLTNLKNIKAYIEAIDVFSDPYTEEVKEFSQFTWMSTQDGSYVLRVPEKAEVAKPSDGRPRWDLFLHEKFRIEQNDLDEWELYRSTSKDPERLLTTENTLHDVFAVADDVIRRCRAERVKLMVREAGWHKDPATDAAKRYLKRLLKKKDSAKCLCEGHHSAGKVCTKCMRVQGITAGECSLAIEKLKVKKG